MGLKEKPILINEEIDKSSEWDEKKKSLILRNLKIDFKDNQ